MATATPPQSGSEDAARIVGVQLEANLVEAGMTRPAARAVHQALELIVLRLLLVVATKDDVRDAVDGLRREFDVRFEAVWERFAAIDRRFDAMDRRLDAMDRRFDRQDLAIAELRREMRWGFGILFTAIVGLLIALLTRGL